MKQRNHQTNNGKMNVFFDLADDDVYINFDKHLDSKNNLGQNLTTKLSNFDKQRNHEALLNCLIKNHQLVRKISKSGKKEES